MKNPVLLLIEQHPSLSCDAIQMLLTIESLGGSAPTSELMDVLNWDKFRISRVTTELLGRSNAKQNILTKALNKNEKSNQVAFIREDIPPSDLRMKLITMTSDAKKYFCPPAKNEINHKQKNSVLFGLVSESLLSSNHVSISAHLPEYINLFMQYIKIIASDMIIDDLNDANILYGWLTADAIDIQQKSESTPDEIKLILNGMTEIRDKIIEYHQSIDSSVERTASACLEFHGYAVINIISGIKDVLAAKGADSGLNSTSEFQQKINGMSFDQQKQIAQKVLTAYRLLTQLPRGGVDFFTQVFLKQAVNLAILADLFKLHTNIDLDKLSTSDLWSYLSYLTNNTSGSLLVTAYGFTLPDGQKRLRNELMNYLHCFPSNNTDHHEKTMQVRNSMLSFLRARPRVEITDPVRLAILNDGVSIFIDPSKTRLDDWFSKTIKNAKKDSQTIILFNPKNSWLDELAINGFQSKELIALGLDDSNYPDKPTAYIFNHDNVPLFMELFNLSFSSQCFSQAKLLLITNDIQAGGIVLSPQSKFQLHAHVIMEDLSNGLFDHPGLGAFKSEEEIKTTSAVWQQVKGIGIGSLTKEELQFLNEWCFYGCELPPLIHQSLTDMPKNRYVTLTPKGWLPAQL